MGIRIGLGVLNVFFAGGTVYRRVKTYKNSEKKAKQAVNIKEAYTEKDSL